MMTKYLKFAASFWMSAFLVVGSLGAAQTTSTAKAKKKETSSSTSTPAATTSNSAQTQSSSATPTPDTSSATPTTAATANVQQSGTTPAAPKMMIGPDKHMIPVPQQ